MATKIITSFEEACKVKGLDPEKVLPDVSCLPESDRKAVTAFSKMCIIHSVLNGDWKADWSDYNQNKFYPWFDVVTKEDSASGVGLSCDDFAYVITGATLGVRLFYKDRETAKYAGQTFIALYEDMILLPK